MTAEADSAAHHTIGMKKTAGSSPKSQDIVAVRRCDVRALTDTTKPLPDYTPHGEGQDPRYPSPRTLRAVVGFGIDLALHVGAGAAAFVVAPHLGLPLSPVVRIAAAGGAFVAASLLHRIPLQWAMRTTLGKALTGLVMIRSYDGGPPTLWLTVRAWLVGAGLLLGAMVDGASS